MLIDKNVILCVIYNICCKKSNIAIYGSLRTFFEVLKIKVNSFLNILENLKKLQANFTVKFIIGKATVPQLR